jgi:prolyl oligopeptidase
LLPWLAQGGIYVMANIRGGGEFGPRWHQAALKEKRQRAYDDFTAVAEDIIRRGYTSPRRLGIEGGSNGGLLMGVAFTQHPDLYRAVLCHVPLLDMLRYTKLPPGASWIGEYGDPEIPEQAAYIARYSPYQNVRAGVRYPEVFFTTSTMDDRVHPGHARKTAARLETFGNHVLFYENTQGGHGGAANFEQEADLSAMGTVYLYQMLFD